MLFFVKAELRRDTNYDRTRWLGLVASTWEQIKQMEADGNVVAGGAFVGQSAGCVIADVASHEELSELINRLPVSAMVTWDVVTERLALEERCHRGHQRQDRGDPDRRRRGGLRDRSGRHDHR